MKVAKEKFPGADLSDLKTKEGRVEQSITNGGHSHELTFSYT